MTDSSGDLAAPAMCFAYNALPSVCRVLLDNGRRVGPTGIRMLWGRVYRPRTRQRSTWDHLCWPLTPLTLSDTSGPSPPLPGSLFTCSARPSVSCRPLSDRRFHCLFLSDLSARACSRTPSFNAPSHYLLPREVWLTDHLLRLQTLCRLRAERSTRAGTLLDYPRVRTAPRVLRLAASSCTCDLPL